MNFNRDPTKQAQDVNFSIKTKNYSPLVFNNASFTQSIYQKHLSIILDSKLTLEDHINIANY